MKKRSSEKWAQFRLSVVGQLLHSPAETGELAARIRELATKTWSHPVSGEPTTFGASTIERWYLKARKATDVFEALQRKTPAHAGTHPSMSAAVVAALGGLRRQYPTWSNQLLHDNLVSLARTDALKERVPSYATTCRYVKRHDLGPRRAPRRHELAEGFVRREKRSFEATHVDAIWHGDFHKTSRRVLTSSGAYQEVVLLAFLDDRSRLCCHAQWYPNFEDTEAFVHGLSQALQKRGLPRVIVTDNGSAMLAAETQEGLQRLGIEHRPTLARTPEQNGKQEVFWGQVEGRLMEMLKKVQPLTLELLNRATQAWVEEEYQREKHRETGAPPLNRWLAGPDVRRPCPPTEQLRCAFRMEIERLQRRSDGTISVESVRFELPNAYRTLRRVRVRVARWDLSSIELVDPERGTPLATLWPLDKARNADARRRVLAPVVEPGAVPDAAAGGPAPLMRELLARYAATGLPPAYIPLDRPAPSQEEVSP